MTMERLLILEDDKNFGELLTIALEGSGYDVTLCSTVEDAGAAIATKTFDLVIADIFIKKDGKLQPDGGIRLIGQLRADQMRSEVPARLSSLPIIAITGAVLKDDPKYFLRVAQQVGADMILAKPFDHKKLLQAIDDLLHASKAQKLDS